MKRFVSLLILMMMMFIFSPQTTISISETIQTNQVKIVDENHKMTISPGDDIQAAIDQLDDGGILTLNPGTYDTLDTIVIKDRKNIILEGIDDVWINTKGIDHHVLTFMNCNNMILRNIKAQHVILEKSDNDPIDDGRDGAVVGVLGGSGVQLEQCELVGCGIYGVYAYSVLDILLEDCYLHDNAKSAVLFVTGSTSMNVTIKDCIIHKNSNAIEVQGDVNIHMEGNNIIEQNSPGDYEGRN